MSPRRMDISSLLRDPSPPPRTRHPDPPPSLLSILNSPSPSLPPPLPPPPPPPRPPFLGFDALVHVASEEHRRISASVDTDHDWRYTHRPSHKRPRDSPSPEPSFVRHHSSASPVGAYPTLRRQPTLNDSRLHSLQHPSHPIPPHNSPRHSPPLFRSHHHSPVSDPDAMSPRYNLGPRMAGGIQVLSTDPPLSNYHSPRRDLSVERFIADPRLEYPRHDPQKLSPISTRVFPSPDPPDSILLRERLRSRPPYSDNGSPISTLESSLLTHPPPDRHPIRMWEDQPAPRETSRPLSSAGMSGDPANVPLSPANEAMQFQRTELPQNENLFLPLANEEPPSPCSRLQSPRKPLSPTTKISQSLPHSEMHLSQTLLPTSLPPESPAQTSECHPKYSEVLVTGSSVPVVSFPSKTNQTPDVADDILMSNPLSRSPSPQALAMQLGSSEPSTHSTHADLAQTATTSFSQHPPDGHNALPRDIPIPPEPPRRSPEPEHPSEREPVPVMMDVDEELLSLVEDRSAPVPSNAHVSRSPPPTTTGKATSAPSLSEREPSHDPPPKPDLKGPHLVIDESKDRASMPPPAARNKKTDKDKISQPTAGGKKKKDATSKTVAKPKQPPKPRAKSTPKPKIKPTVVDTPSKAAIPKSVANVNGRSRSTSVMPGAADDAIPEPEAENSDKEDDKLYCVCKMRYDEDRMMIACDRCDEWFHTLCVNVPDLEIDLVDQFICPPCIQKHPHLRTTWKRRCLFGLHQNPSSSEPCHRPSRGAFSKYCSDECGIKYMQAHIAQWENLGGARDRLWQSVKNAAKREGVVVPAKTNGPSSSRTMDVGSNNSVTKPLDTAARRRAEREVARLNSRLEEVVRERELMKRELDMVMWRERVVELASERAAKVDECGWDQRLCFGEEEWTDFGPEVLESYEDARVKVESGDDAMALDSASAMLGEWWCTGKKKCERHGGWQKLRTAEVSFDKETKEGLLLKLTTREREIRKWIEDILYPQPVGTLQAPSKPPPPDIQLNGLEKRHASERGKKGHHNDTRTSQNVPV